MSGWYYIESTFLGGDQQIGPISNDELLRLAQEGMIKPETSMTHEKHTRGRWMPMSKIPAAMKRYEAGERQREAEKVERRREAEERRERRRVEREQFRRQQEEERRRLATERAEELASAPFAKFLGDGQDPNVIAEVFDRIVEFLTPNEVIEYICVALHLPGFMSPDCVVATNRRFMVVRQKLLGRLEFDDYSWLDLSDARVKEGIMSSELSFRTTSGGLFKIGYLPKSQARRLYSFSQQREEDARELRRQRVLEEKRAGAGNINVGASPPSAPPQPVAPQPTADDPVQKLTSLKQMLDAGLIEQAEYDAKKARILEVM